MSFQFGVNVFVGLIQPLCWISETGRDAFARVWFVSASVLIQIGVIVLSFSERDEVFE